MLVAFDAAVFDPAGSVIIDALPSSSLNTSTRRITRTATLDGNAVIIDNGFTASDSTPRVNAYLSAAQEATVLRLCQLYPEVVCSTPFGCYLGVIDDVRRDTAGITAIQFTILRDISR